jgi:hypothetical protein
MKYTTKKCNLPLMLLADRKLMSLTLIHS